MCIIRKYSFFYFAPVLSWGLNNGPIMKKTLYLLYIPMLIIEWFLDMLVKIWQVLHNSVKELTLALENYINEPTGKADNATTNTGQGN